MEPKARADSSGTRIANRKLSWPSPEPIPQLARHFWLVTITVTLLGTLSKFPGIQTASAGRNSFRQSHTALLIQQFMEGGFDLRSPLPILGPPYFVPYEFPLFEGIAAVFGALLGLSPLAVGGAVSLALFGVSALLVAVLLRQWFNATVAVAAALAMQTVAFGWIWAPESLIEFLPVAAMLAAAAIANQWSRKPVSWAPLLIVVSVVAAYLVKPPSALVLTPLLMPPLVQFWVGRRERGVKGSVVIAGSPLLGLLAAVIWTQYADGIKAASPFTEFLTSQELRSWNFGFPSQRVLPDQFLAYGANLEAIVGPFLVFLLLGVVMVSWRPARLPVVALGAAPILAFLVFPNLYVVHQYYVAAVMAPVVGLLAVATVRTSQFLADLGGRVIFILGVIVVWSLATWGSSAGSAASHFFVQFGPSERAAEFQSMTPPNAGLLLIGCDWDPTFLFESQRKGLMLRSTEGVVIPSDWLMTELTHVGWCYESDSVPPLPDGFDYAMISPHVAKIFPTSPTSSAWAD